MSKSAHALVFCRLFFIHNFPCQLGRGHSLFIYFYVQSMLQTAHSAEILSAGWTSIGDFQNI